MKGKNQNIEMGSLIHSEKNEAIVRSINDQCSDILKMVGDDPNNPANVKTALANDLLEQDAKEEFRLRVCKASGYKNHELGMIFLAKTNEASGKNNDSLLDCVTKFNVLAKTMYSLEPKDEIEGKLIAQLIILHEHSMEWLGKALRTDQINFANICLNATSKLLVRHHETLASLLKYRRGDEQRVHVEHVHVHNGGQAIVGNVGTGGGLNKKSEEGPHAKV